MEERFIEGVTIFDKHFIPFVAGILWCHNFLLIDIAKDIASKLVSCQ